MARFPVVMLFPCKGCGVSVPALSAGFCPKCQKDTSYSGKILLRVVPALHRHLAKVAEERGVSLNMLVATIAAERTGFKG